VIRAALNHLLAQRADRRAGLVRHAGRTARISVPPLRADFAIDAEGWLQPAEGEPEATITVAPALLPRLLLDDPSARRDVRLEGDAVLAADLAHLLQQLDWDAEADLARVLGDIPAHRIVSDMRRLFGDPRTAARELAETAVEYLQEEAAVLARRPSLERFLADVDAMRDDLARLEKRLSLLESPNTKG